jgi:hypothetical protein
LLRPTNGKTGIIPIMVMAVVIKRSIPPTEHGG